MTVGYANGCSSVASVSVSQNIAAPMVSITASPSLTINQGQSTTLTANLSGGTAPFTYTWSTGSNSSSIVVNMSGPYSVTATGANGCSGTATTTVTVSGPFAITAVTTVSCDPILPNRFSLSFNPRYQGLNGSPVSFSVTNELFPTTQPGPYTLQLYSDNPTITLNAVQSGVSSSFVYNWLAACNSATTPNTPPRVAMGIPSQTATVGSYFSYVIPDGTFTDTETPGSLKLSATGSAPRTELFRGDPVGYALHNGGFAVLGDHHGHRSGKSIGEHQLQPDGATSQWPTPDNGSLCHHGSHHHQLHPGCQPDQSGLFAQLPGHEWPAHRLRGGQ